MRVKSGSVSVSPMKNMTTPSDQVIDGASGLKASGRRNPSTPAMTTRTGRAVTAMIELRSAVGAAVVFPEDRWAGASGMDIGYSFRTTDRVRIAIRDSLPNSESYGRGSLPPRVVRTWSHDVYPHPAAPRRERVEPEESVHRMGRRDPDRQRPRRRRTCRRTPAREGAHPRRRLHLPAQACDPHREHRAGGRRSVLARRP